jgi:hypothetical protein
MTTYNQAFFDPPAPAASVTLRSRESGEAVDDVVMLIDSGADVTLIPRASAQRLNVESVENELYELTGFDGSRSYAPVIQLQLVFLNRIFSGRFLLIDQEWGILGRDVLNRVGLILDGPALTWSEAPPVK